MPCKDIWPTESEIREEAERAAFIKRHDSLVAMMCKMGKVLTDKQLLAEMPEEFIDWYREHQKQDKLRRSLERKAKKFKKNQSPFKH